jgi:hypothetical protein
VEEVRIDEVVETTEEDEDHTTSEWSGANDGCDPVYTGGSSGPGKGEEALSVSTVTLIIGPGRGPLTMGSKIPPRIAGGRRCSAGNHPPSAFSRLLYRGFS